ncbi:MAG: 4-hydroxy-tetrahydrodipicolinate reductase [Armatimonadetes bacterium]|nr:4-hydroxy-tetrahydrodipicolinate reductase [Armatimonadota bacterium]
MDKPIIRVAISGAGGRMGRETALAVYGEAHEMVLVGAADPAYTGKTLSELLAIDCPIEIKGSLTEALDSAPADVAVVFSVPSAAMSDIRTAMNAGAVPVVGTTGITEENLAEIKELAEKKGIGAIIAPNFAIGAVLMMKFAAEAAKYFPAVEIIELHHDKKLDAPSGTAIKTAQMISNVRSRDSASKGDNTARGAEFHGVNIHSVRLPGLVAHQEVIFGGVGQTLTIRHDSIDRKSFMPGVLLAIKRAVGLTDVIYGLEKIL